jgi:hypothetical protein
MINELNKSYALRACKFNLLVGFINGCGIHGVNQVKQAYRSMFIEHATFVQVMRISGFKWVSLENKTMLTFVFNDRTIAVSSENIDRARFIDDDNYSKAIMELFARLICR